MKCNDMVQLKKWIEWIECQFATGSRVIGGVTPSSDFDYVATAEDVKEAATSLGIDSDMVNAEEYANSFISFKYRMKEDGPWVNLIVVPDLVDFNAWIYATSTLIELPADLIKDSRRRKEMFGWMLNEYYRKAGVKLENPWHEPVKKITPKQQVSIDLFIR